MLMKYIVGTVIILYSRAMMTCLNTFHRKYVCFIKRECKLLPLYNIYKMKVPNIPIKSPVKYCCIRQIKYSIILIMNCTVLKKCF